MNWMDDNMHGYPQVIATVQDFENLLSDKEHKEQALNDLQNLQDFDDRGVTMAVKPLDPDKPDGEWETKIIENPNPIHRQKGFEQWIDVVTLNAEHTLQKKETIDSKVDTILNSYPVEEIEDAPVEMT
ncbi:hypothetical protein [Methanobacterium spitsbergense]|uniref:Uncharacterized protein n=1 Tax=Methanobacterium spitsbergense TaxID=2874285 RepID=A0A8T5UZP5_9EURY|nr:hypothetical protein [Methanobacterium spitsbergense]MBZ2166283.1 hypothetical protein [Methanobacterium spitsbergense]